MSDLIEALTILRKYDDSRNPTHCEHDVLTVATNPALVSEDDKARLDELGFFVDEHGECFQSFRFGSC